jgi:hypothetical protein
MSREVSPYVAYPVLAFLTLVLALIIINGIRSITWIIIIQ